MLPLVPFGQQRLQDGIECTLEEILERIESDITGLRIDDCEEEERDSLESSSTSSDGSVYCIQVRGGIRVGSKLT